MRLIAISVICILLSSSSVAFLRRVFFSLRKTSSSVIFRISASCSFLLCSFNSGDSAFFVFSVPLSSSLGGNSTIKFSLFIESFFVLIPSLSILSINAVSSFALSLGSEIEVSTLLKALQSTRLKFFARSSNTFLRFLSLQKSNSGLITLYRFCAFLLQSITCFLRSFDFSLTFPFFFGA